MDLFKVIKSFGMSTDNITIYLDQGEYWIYRGYNAVDDSYQLERNNVVISLGRCIFEKHFIREDL